MSTSPVYIGVDVSCDCLAVHGPGLKPFYPNSPQGFASLIKALPAAAHVVLEATGGYQLNLVLALHQQGLPVSVLNGRHVRDFAKAMGCLAKTDKIDAALIAEFAAAKRPSADRPPTDSQLRLAELVCRRQQLVELHLSESNRLLHLRLPLLRAQIRRLLGVLERNIAMLEKLIAETIASDPCLEAKSKRLREVEGIGLISSATLLALMPELGSLSRSRAAALAGVAPFARDSGYDCGKRHIGGGRTAVRNALYMSALTAIVRNRTLKLFYDHLRSTGKPAKVALTAVMRKLICLLNHLLKSPAFSLAS
jgi:transposase